MPRPRSYPFCLFPYQTSHFSQPLLNPFEYLIYIDISIVSVLQDTGKGHGKQHIREAGRTALMSTTQFRAFSSPLHPSSSLSLLHPLFYVRDTQFLCIDCTANRFLLCWRSSCFYQRRTLKSFYCLSSFSASPGLRSERSIEKISQDGRGRPTKRGKPFPTLREPRRTAQCDGLPTKAPPL